LSAAQSAASDASASHGGGALSFDRVLLGQEL
jgi:hypothetical protein